MSVSFPKVVTIIWYRDLLRYWRNKVRAISGLTFPILWLVIFGTGISKNLQFSQVQTPSDLNFSYATFLFPGIIGLNIIFTSVFSAVSIISDREFGFMREILVAPIPRAAIALGKTLSGTTIAVIQALLVVALAPLVGISLNWHMIGLLVPAMVAVAFALSAFGVLIASRLKSQEAGQYVFQFVTFPLFFLSGGLFPLTNLPAWMEIAVKLNPVSYAMDLMRKAVLLGGHVPQLLIDRLSFTVFGNPVKVTMDLVVVLGFAGVMLALGLAAFSKSD